MFVSSYMLSMSCVRVPYFFISVEMYGAEQKDD